MLNNARAFVTIRIFPVAPRKTASESFFARQGEGIKRMNKKWIYKLEYKYGRFCIPNLMLAIVIGQLMVYLADLFAPAAGISSLLALSWSSVMRGQVWRLLTFIFVPEGISSPIWLLVSLYFYYFIGKTLEGSWGSFRFCLYYLFGMIGAILAGALTGLGTTLYLNYSLFWAMAMLYPDMQVLLFFILPIKIKYLGILSGVMVFLSFLFTSGVGKAAILFALLNFILFFGGDLIAKIREEIKYGRQRRAWRNQNRNYRN